MSKLLRRFGDAGMRHGSYVESLAFAPDGPRLATSGADDRVRIWDAVAGVRLASLARGGFFGNGIGFLDGSVVFSGERGVMSAAPDGSAPAVLFEREPEWDAVSLRSGGRRVVVLESRGFGETTVVSHRARIFSGGALRTIDLAVDRAWLSPRMANAPARADLAPFAIALSPDGRWLAVLGHLPAVRLESVPASDAVLLLASWDLDAPEAPPAIAALPQREGDAIDPDSFSFDGGASSFLLSPDGRRVAIRGPVVRVLDRESGRELSRPVIPEGSLRVPEPSVIAFARGGHELVLVTASGIAVLDATSGALLRRRDSTGTSAAAGLCVSDSAATLAIANDSAVVVLSLDTLEPRLAPADHAAAITAVAVDPRGRSVVSGDESMLLRSVRAETGETLWSRREEGTVSLAFSADGTRLLSSGPRILDAECGEVLSRSSGGFSICAWTPDGDVACVDVGFGGRPEDDRLLLRFGEGSDGRVAGREEIDAAFQPVLSRDGSTALTRSAESWSFWDVPARRKLAVVPADLSSAALAPDGAAAAIHLTVENRIEIRSRDGGEIVGRINLNELPASMVAWLPGDRLVVGTTEGDLVVYALSRANLASIPEPERLTGGHDGSSVRTLGASADGTFLVSGATDGTVALWRIA